MDFRAHAPSEDVEMLDNPSYTIKTCQMKKLVKVVAFGSSGSGKTTLIKHMDPSLRNIESRKGTATTVAFDLGIVNRGAYKMHVYGTPGNERFKVAMRVVSVGMNFGLVVVDATRNMTPFEKGMLEELRTMKIPHIVVANKMDAPGASLDNLRSDVGLSTPILPVSGITGSGTEELVDLIVTMVERYN
jgi:uncharacterized protein